MEGQVGGEGGMVRQVIAVNLSYPSRHGNQVHGHSDSWNDSAQQQNKSGTDVYCELRISMISPLITEFNLSYI